MEMPPGPPSPGSGPPLPPPPPDESLPVEAPSDFPDAAPLTDEERNRRVVATTGALALVAVAVMITVFLVTQDRGPEAATPAASTVPITAPPEEEPARPAELRALVEELQPFVAEERGLEFEEDVQLEVLGEEAYADRVHADFDADLEEDRDDIVNSAHALQALGLWPQGLDPVETIREFAAVASGGFYDPETSTMVIRGTGDTPLLRSTLVHELTHALDDQHFELDRPALDDRTDEAGFAFHSVVEGSAERVEAAYRETLTDEELAEAETAEQAIGASIDLDDVPPILLLQQGFAYDQGAAFVEAVHEAGGNSAVDRALRRPPVTSETILEPDSWPPGEAAAVVPVPEADEEPIEDGVVGQFLLHLLTNVSDPEGAVRPEWDGDNAVVWAGGDDVYCIRMVIRGDVAGIESGLADWAGQVGADVTAADDEVRVRSCR